MVVDNKCGSVVLIYSNDGNVDDDL